MKSKKTEKRKTECLNPNTGRRMNIDTEIYALIQQAILESLRNSGALTYTEIVEHVGKFLKGRKVKFNHSVEWYTVTVKNDLEARGRLRSASQKGKKLHWLPSSSARN